MIFHASCDHQTKMEINTSLSFSQLISYFNQLIDVNKKLLAIKFILFILIAHLLISTTNTLFSIIRKYNYLFCT